MPYKPVTRRDVRISPVTLEQVATEVLRYPIKTKNRSTDKMVELVEPAGIQLNNRFGRPEIQVMGLADTGAQIDVLAGEELFPAEALTVGRRPLSGGP